MWVRSCDQTRSIWFLQLPNKTEGISRVLSHSNSFQIFQTQSQHTILSLNHNLKFVFPFDGTRWVLSLSSSPLWYVSDNLENKTVFIHLPKLNSTKVSVLSICVLFRASGISTSDISNLGLLNHCFQFYWATHVNMLFPDRSTSTALQPAVKSNWANLPSEFKNLIEM